jgi:hypothetical protein
MAANEQKLHAKVDEFGKRNRRNFVAKDKEMITTLSIKELREIWMAQHKLNGEPVWVRDLKQREANRKAYWQYYKEHHPLKAVWHAMEIPDLNTLPQIKIAFWWQSGTISDRRKHLSTDKCTLFACQHGVIITVHRCATGMLMRKTDTNGETVFRAEFFSAPLTNWIFWMAPPVSYVEGQYRPRPSMVIYETWQRNHPPFGRRPCWYPIDEQHWQKELKPWLDKYLPETTK